MSLFLQKCVGSHPKISASLLVHFAQSGVGGVPSHFSLLANTSPTYSPDDPGTCIGSILWGNPLVVLCPNISGTPLAWPVCSPRTCLTCNNCIGSKPPISLSTSCSLWFWGVTPPMSCPMHMPAFCPDPTCPWHAAPPHWPDIHGIP